jgi:hypothetical protein
MSLEAALILVATLIVAVVLLTLAWRLASRRQSLPCPVWLRWLVELDNPFTRTNRAAYIVETLRLSQGMSVLDAGLRPGTTDGSLGARRWADWPRPRRRSPARDAGACRGEDRGGRPCPC